MGTSAISSPRSEAAHFIVLKRAHQPRDRLGKYRVEYGHVSVTAMACDRLGRLLKNLQKPELFDHPIAGFELAETHISYVLLAGPYAYKFKKPVQLRVSRLLYAREAQVLL